MPDHPRKLIRQRVKILLSGTTGADARVYASPALPLRKKQELPAILVVTPEDPTVPESISSAPRLLEHELTLIVSGIHHGTDGAQLADDLDDLAQEIETAMHEDPQLAGCAGDLWLTGTTIDIEIDGDRLIGACQLTYQIQYHDLAPAAPTDLDDFQTAATTYKLGAGQHDDDDAHDVIIVQAVSENEFGAGFSEDFA